MDSYNARLSSVPQMQSSSPLFQFGRLAVPMKEAAERQQFRSWMLRQLHNTPVEKSDNTTRLITYWSGAMEAHAGLMVVARRARKCGCRHAPRRRDTRLIVDEGLLN